MWKHHVTLHTQTQTYPTLYPTQLITLSTSLSLLLSEQREMVAVGPKIGQAWCAHHTHTLFFVQLGLVLWWAEMTTDSLCGRREGAG